MQHCVERESQAADSKRQRECREADYLTSPLLMKSTLKSGASHPSGRETTARWDGAEAGLTAWCDVMNMILALHNILSAFLCISLHSYCSSPSLPVDFLPAFQATGKVMPTVCACEDSYHRQVQEGGGTWRQREQYAPPCSSPFATGALHVPLWVSLPLASTPFLSLHPSLSVCARARLSVANIPVRVAHALRRLMEDRGPPSAWTRLVARVWEIYSILNFVATLAKEQKYWTYLCQTHWGQNFRDSRQTSKSVWVAAGRYLPVGSTCVADYSSVKNTPSGPSHIKTIPQQSTAANKNSIFMLCWGELDEKEKSSGPRAVLCLNHHLNRTRRIDFCCSSPAVVLNWKFGTTVLSDWLQTVKLSVLSGM